MTHTLTLSGWTQPVEALLPIAPGAATFDFSAYASVEDSFDSLSIFRDVPNVVAWSMGAQLTLRAIAAGVLRPRHVTLIGAPYRFVSTEKPDGISEQTFSQFRDNYASDAARTKDRFHALVAKGDDDMRRIVAGLSHHPEVENTARFLPWLDDLGRFDAATLDLANMPPTLIIHGMNDHIVPHAQAVLLQRRLPNAQLNSWAGTAHAPHVKDAARVRAEIEAHRSALGLAA
ncbi:MAG: alpha/beta fold hydrolase [Rickettsiales bacterium]